MKLLNISRRQRGQCGRIAGVLMMFLWLATFALAASPQLHQLLHADASSANHSCLVTQVQRHPLLAGAEVIALPTAPALVITFVPHSESQFVPSDDHFFPPALAAPSAA